MFLSSVQNDTKQIFVTCRELNDAKVALINSKVWNIPEVIKLNEIENWKCIKGKSLWVNKCYFNSLEEVKRQSISAFHLKHNP